MRLRKMLLTLLACVALAAMGASAAQAAEGDGWTINGVKLASGVHEPITIAKNAGSTLSLTAELLGAKVALDAANVECAVAGECTIDNTTEAGHSEGRLKFTGVTVTTPAHCMVHSPGQVNGTVVTEPLTDKVIMDPTAGSTAVFDKFFPETGKGWVELEFIEEAGSECAFAGVAFPVEGTVTGQAVHAEDAASKTGEQFATQSLLFNEAAQKTGGGLLYLAGNKTKPIYLDGTVNNVLTNHPGTIWGVD